MYNHFPHLSPGLGNHPSAVAAHSSPSVRIIGPLQSHQDSRQQTLELAAPCSSCMLPCYVLSGQRFCKLRNPHSLCHVYVESVVVCTRRQPDSRQPDIETGLEDSKTLSLPLPLSILGLLPARRPRLLASCRSLF